MTARCPSCGLQTLAYKGDILAPRGLWACPCGYAVTGRPPGWVAPKPVKARKVSKPVGRPPTTPAGIAKRAALIEATASVALDGCTQSEPAHVPEHRPRPPQYVPRQVEPTRKNFRPLQYPRVTAVVCRVMGVSVEEVEGVLRNPDIVLAREIIVAVLRDGSRMSYPDIAEQLRGSSTKNATTCEAHKRIQSQLDMPLLERLGEHSPTLKRVQDKTVGDLLDRIRRLCNGQETPESGAGSDEAGAQGG